jgi:hypothetical protein
MNRTSGICGVEEGEGARSSEPGTIEMRVPEEGAVCGDGEERS